MYFNGQKTTLQRGDEVRLDTEARTLSFSRKDQNLLFSGNECEKVFPWGDSAFSDLVVLLIETHDLGEFEEQNIKFNGNKMSYVFNS